MGFNKKLNDLSLSKKIYVIILLLFVFGSFFYLVAGTKSIETITYGSGCVEVFVNNKINGSYCEEERRELEANNAFDVGFNNLELENISIS